MSGVQSDETQKNGTQYCVLQTHLPFTSLPAVALSVYSRSGSSCAQHEHQSLHMYKECMLAVRLVLVVVGAVCCCCNARMSYIYVGLLHI